MWFGISKYESLIFALKLKEIRCEMHSAGSGYGPAAFSFVRVNALESYKCRKISWWLSNHYDYSSRWNIFVMTSIAHVCVVLRFSKCILHIYFSIHVVLWDTFVSVKKTTLKNSKDKFDLASVNCDSVRLCWPNINWRFGSQEMATESYVNVSTAHAAVYSGLLSHVMIKTCRW